MATTTQNQDEGRSRSMHGAATSQDTNQGGRAPNQGGAMQRAATSQVERERLGSPQPEGRSGEGARP